MRGEECKALFATQPDYADVPPLQTKPTECGLFAALFHDFKQWSLCQGTILKLRNSFFASLSEPLTRILLRRTALL